ncbi:MAG: DUF393 domain-containing protein [Saprospiraceae bacterium]
MKSILFFDSECILCSSLTRWIVEKDTLETIDIRPLSSPATQQYFLEHQFRFLPETLIFINDGNVYYKSQAVRQLLIKLHYCTICGWVLDMVPRFISDGIYDVIARFRKWL